VNLTAVYCVKARRDLFRDQGSLISASYTHSVDRHLEVSTCFPSLAETGLPNLSILSRWSGFRYLGVESCSVELCLFVAKHLMLPQTSPRFTKKYPTLPRIVLPGLWIGQNNMSDPIAALDLVAAAIHRRRRRTRIHTEVGMPSGLPPLC
jgi:hypothetical protein